MNTGTPSPAPRAFAQPGSYLTAIRVGEHAGYDRVVFQFSGGLPVYDVDRVGTVYSDPKGTPVPLAGQSFLWVVFRGASAVCGPTVIKTYPGPSTLTPFYPELLVISAAGDFEGYLSFGIGLAAPGGYHVLTLTDPDRVVIDVSHVALGKFPGIWPVTSWPWYWALQYSWNTGHQPWLATPAMVVQAWARDRWHVALPVRQVNADTFQVGRLDTVTGTRPITHGPWVITTVTAGLPPRPAESACWAPGDLSGWRWRARRTASSARLSTRSCWRSPTPTRCCGPAIAPGCGQPPSWPPTRAAGGRSTGPGTP